MNIAELLLHLDKSWSEDELRRLLVLKTLSALAANLAILGDVVYWVAVMKVEVSFLLWV